MAVRLKTRWNLKDKERTIQETAGALAFNSWRIGLNMLLNLENEGFQTDTQLHRLEVIKEIMAFLIHVLDRIAYERMDDEERARFVTALARKIADYVQDNARDFAGPGDHRSPFIERLNERMDGYAEFAFSDFEPSFQMTRYFGDRMAATLGERQRQWVATQMIDIEVPAAMKSLRRAVDSLLPASEGREADG
ncbi:hypothetical protein QVG61_07330 [Thiohalobacter sp. IOR34]|uniref:hypothetical protein n=1 Tax=Thiohalobacter sp. IOR34 TaxID=3057176 RepID=UPI0025B1CB36|nr:hypothetical protein [Thiohalobacter sp. IOR34]WJW74332.1 hypothetical protein QVG61_07330 [Thiohalobacter sp. IOR34]